MTAGLPLGIEGRRAIVCGSSGGLGYACAVALVAAGVDVVMNGRSEERLEAAARTLMAKTGRAVRSVVADVTCETDRERLLAECPEPDILVTNGAGPPPGSFKEWGEEEWHRALHTSMVAPLLLIRASLGGMRSRRWGRIINITSTSVRAPLPLLGLSNGARSGFTGFIAGLARDCAIDGVTINNLLPGNFDTGRFQDYVGALARSRGMAEDAVLHDIVLANPTRRLGRPSEFGAACAFLASDLTGYITGQNWLLDGGSYPGVF
jgi:3-oxoacyl-[acyl-carrier protein] reductase